MGVIVKGQRNILEGMLKRESLPFSAHLLDTRGRLSSFETRTSKTAGCREFLGV